MIRWMVIIILAIIWCGFSNDFGLINLTIGLSIAAATEYLIPRTQSENSQFKLHKLLSLLLYIVIELFKSSLLVAWEVLTPNIKCTSLIFKIPLDCKSDLEIMIFSNLISLTPGTLVLEIEEQREYIIIHDMFSKSEIESINNIKYKLERLVLEVFHP